MFGINKSKNEKKLRGTNKTTAIIPEKQSSSINFSSISSQYSTTTIKTTETKISQSIMTYGSLDRIQNPKTGFGSGSREFKRLSVDATPFTTASGATGYQSTFTRRLTPISSSTRVPTSTAPSTSSVANWTPKNSLAPSLGISTNIPGSSITSSSSSNIASNPFIRQNRLYNSERVVPNRNTSTNNVPMINYATNNISASVVPEYHTKGTKRGHILVINNIKFLESKLERNGAEHDERDVISMFKNFGFDVEKHRNLKRDGILEKVTKYRSAKYLGKYDMSVVIIMSHGDNISIPGGYTEIIGIDGQGISTETIVNEFTAQKCPALKGKPKIFIFQCCRGQAAEIKVDSAPIAGCIKNNADVLIAYSTLPGFYSLRDPEKGSWYIQCICKVFQEHAKQHHVEDLLKIVDQKLSEKHPDYKQTSTYENRGFKQCYLNPK